MKKENKKTHSIVTLQKALKEYKNRNKASLYDYANWYSLVIEEGRGGSRIRRKVWLAPQEYQKCCDKYILQIPDDPLVLFRHGKSVQHIARLYDVFQKDLRHEILKTKILDAIIS